MTDHEGFEIERHMPFQQREWAVQRAGWCLLGGFVVLAALGLFGAGPLSHAEGSDADRARITFERFIRVEAPARVAIERKLDGARSKNGLRLSISRPFFDSVRIEQLTPEPVAVDVGPDEVGLQFEAPTDTARTFSVTLDFRPQKGGRQTAAFRWADGAAVRVTQFVYY